MAKKYLNRLTKLLLEGEPNSDSLRKKCIRITFDELENKDDERLIVFLRDLQNHGCQSGMINKFIYYDDTIAFYEENKEAINDFLYELMQNTGINSLSEMFRDKYDNEDPLCLGTSNRNLLTWLVYEETMYKLVGEIGLENKL